MALFPLKTAQFAEVRLVGESLDSQYDSTGGVPVASGSTPNNVVTHTIGIAINLRFNENLGSTQKNVIGTPVPIFVPGYYQGTITVEKATLDLEGWKTMANINPYTAYVPSTYDTAGGINGVDYTGTDMTGNGALSESQNKIPRFLFGLYVYDRVQDEASAPTGIYVCMLQSFNNTISANDAVIMEDVTLLARPVNGSWLSVLRDTFTLDTYFGYNSNILPQKGIASS